MPSLNELVAQLLTSVRRISADALKARIDAGESITLLDVRERDEFSQGHIGGALSIPRGLVELRIEQLASARETPLVVYCAGSTRALLAARALHELGYDNVEALDGGFLEWKRRGFPFEMPTDLAPDQLTRYSRHLLIPEIGEAGQRRLLDARVALLGAGGLGSPAALYLAAAGVGTLGIIDDDVVDRSNLQRQVLHTDDRVGMLKVESAAATLRALNPDVQVARYPRRLEAANVAELLAGYDVVVDGGDNFATRYLVNDACVHLGIPNVHGSVYRFDGQVTTFAAQGRPCYRCLYPEPPPAELAPSCQEAGVLGVLPGVIGLLQAIEVVKLIVGIGEPLLGRLLTFDALRTEFRELRYSRDPACRMCGDQATFDGFETYAEFCRSAR